MTATMFVPTDTPAAPPAFWHPTDPYLVAEDTWVVGPLAHAPGAPFGVHVNSMVIRGREPVLVDTGPAAARDLWFDSALSLVDPEDVRWIFLSHEEPDHAGNLLELLDLCPQATVVTSWFALERLSALHPVPLDRVRWLNDGESLDVGDRTLHLVQPPVYDAPTTRGLFDDRTGVYWAVDAFGVPVEGPMQDAADMPEHVWHDVVLQFSQMISPWHTLLDQRRFDAHVDRVRSLRPSVVTTAHGPALRGPRLDAAFELVRSLPQLPPVQLFGQAELDAILAAGV
jgi:flavorubredoxin